MSARACPSLEDGVGLAAPLLAHVDCRINAYVEVAYASLFGPFGALAPVLTIALTIYVAVYGLQLITGRSGLTLSGFAPKVFAIGLVIAFATRWGAYHGFFVDLVYRGADQLGYLLAGAGDDGASVLDRLDSALVDITKMASSWNETAPLRPDAVPPEGAIGEAPPLPVSTSAVNLLWFSAAALGLSTIGLLIICKVLLGLLLAVGPVLLVAALFPATRGLFEGWLRSLAHYALVPALTMVLAGGALAVIEPMVGSIVERRNWGADATQSVFILAMTTFIVGLLAVQLLRMCAHLTNGWRLPAAAPSSAATGEPTPSLQGAAAASQRRESDPRVADLVVAIERNAQQGGGPSRRIASPAPVGSAGALSAPSTFQSRRVSQRYQHFNRRTAAEGGAA